MHPAARAKRRENLTRAASSLHARRPTLLPVLALTPSTRKLNTLVAKPAVTDTAPKAPREAVPACLPRSAVCTTVVMGPAAAEGHNLGKLR